MRVVVTGAAGHIGSALIRDARLIKATDEIVLMDDFSTQRYPSVFGLPHGCKYRLIEGDLRRTFTAEVAAGADAVFHFAAMTDLANSFGSPDATTRHNLGLTEHVAANCLQAQAPLVFLSSTSVYTPTSSIVDETSAELQPESPYAQCKLLEEQTVTRQFESGLRGVIFRLGTIYGVSPGMRFHTAVNRFCWQAATGQTVQVWSTAMDQVRPYLAVADAVRAFVKTALEGFYPDHVMNLASTNSTVREILTAIEAFGVHPRVELVDSPAMNSLSYAASSEYAKSCGFTLDTSLEIGVAETLQVLSGLLRLESSTKLTAR